MARYSAILLGLLFLGCERPVYVSASANDMQRYQIATGVAVREFRLSDGTRCVVISTGAAPGFFGLAFGKLLGARTIWIDSMANVEELSLSGRQVRRFADLWLTQWPHLARPDGPRYEGGVV